MPEIDEITRAVRSVLGEMTSPETAHRLAKALRPIHGREAVAAGIAHVQIPGGLRHDEYCGADGLLMVADAALAALAAAGYIILPREPSAEMIEAACLATHGKCFEVTSKLQPAWADLARRWMRAAIKSALAAGEVE